MPLDGPKIPARTTDLIAHAESMGLSVWWAANLPEDGRYIEATRMIVLQYGMTERKTVSVLAHEIAHARHGDFCSEGPQEDRAWRYAAALLIHPDDYAIAERLDHSPGALAAELGVTVEVIRAYQAQAEMRAAA